MTNGKSDPELSKQVRLIHFRGFGGAASLMS